MLAAISRMALLQPIPSMLSHAAPIWCCLAVSVRNKSLHRWRGAATRRVNGIRAHECVPVSYHAATLNLSAIRRCRRKKMGCWKYRAAWMYEHAEEIEQLVRHIQGARSGAFLPTEHAQKGVSGWWNGNHINATLRVYFLPPEKSWLLSGVLFNVYMI